jgi:hypothetical protein
MLMSSSPGKMRFMACDGLPQAAQVTQWALIEGLDTGRTASNASIRQGTGKDKSKAVATNWSNCVLHRASRRRHAVDSQLQTQNILTNPSEVGVGVAKEGTGEYITARLSYTNSSARETAQEHLPMLLSADFI